MAGSWPAWSACWNTCPTTILDVNASSTRHEELLALKGSVSELGSMGRNLNQIARAANQGDRVAGPGREDLRAMLRICEALRDHVKGLITANLESWERGHAD